MAAKIGHKVLLLERVAIGPLRLGDMPAGAYRDLATTELRALQNCVSSNPSRRKKSDGPRRGRRSENSASSERSRNSSGKRAATVGDRKPQRGKSTTTKTKNAKSSTTVKPAGTKARKGKPQGPKSKGVKVQRANSRRKTTEEEQSDFIPGHPKAR